MNEETYKAVRNAFNEAYARIYTEHQRHQEVLTREQFVDALAQAIASGDFTREIIIEPDGTEKQRVIYKPYREVQELKEKLRDYTGRLYHIQKLIPPLL